ncbi:hypothetical protein FA95DRAFT_1684453 [Auriscalpium vulgare]|uniref:Uncharacterized protein n=1 Tax=Auriscalpium vulgare TaxID=40419 RepID=A0ACB8R4J5_9AGAM|nr:hypothetical protein FA95DRAFT_1684453 [Auriscalpium vulgare]
MKNWKDPSVILSTEQAFVRLSHVVLGLILWEIVTTCDYDIDVLRGRRRYLPTFWIYFTCRLSMAVSLIILVIPKDVVGVRNCTALGASIYVFGYLSLAMASSLILLRIFAVWQRQLAVVAVSSVLWASSIALNVRYIVILRSEYVPELGECIESPRPIINNIGIIGSDLGLLAIMLVGILRHHKDMSSAPRGFGGLWSLLWHQGVIWLVMAAMVEVPTLVFIILNLNDPWDVMFEIVTLATLSISATRMYRVLTDYRPRTDLLPIHVPEHRAFVSRSVNKIHGSSTDEATRVGVSAATWNSNEVVPVESTDGGGAPRERAHD